MGEQVIPPMRLSMKEMMNPHRIQREPCLVAQIGLHDFKVDFNMLRLITIYRGTTNENPYTLMREFEDVVSTMMKDVARDIMRKTIFSFSLTKKAKLWFNLC